MSLKDKQLFTFGLPFKMSEDKVPVLVVDVASLSTDLLEKLNNAANARNDLKIVGILTPYAKQTRGYEILKDNIELDVDVSQPSAVDVAMSVTTTYMIKSYEGQDVCDIFVISSSNATELIVKFCKDLFETEILHGIIENWDDDYSEYIYYQV